MTVLFNSKIKVGSGDRHNVEFAQVALRRDPRKIVPHFALSLIYTPSPPNFSLPNQQTSTLILPLSFNPQFDIQVLSPMSRGLVGTRNLNQMLQEITRGEMVFRVGYGLLTIEL